MISMGPAVKPDGGHAESKQISTKKDGVAGGVDFSVLLQGMIVPVMSVPPSVMLDGSKTQREVKSALEVGTLHQIGFSHRLAVNAASTNSAAKPQLVHQLEVYPTELHQPEVRLPNVDIALGAPKSSIAGVDARRSVGIVQLETSRYRMVASPLLDTRRAVTASTGNRSAISPTASVANTSINMLEGFLTVNETQSRSNFEKTVKSSKSEVSAKPVREASSLLHIDGQTSGSAASKAVIHWLLDTPTSALVTHPNQADATVTPKVLDLHQTTASNTLSSLVVQHVRSGVDQFQVKVHPEGLGNLVISVHRTDQGLNVHIVASESVTATWIQQERFHIMDAIQANGQQLNSFQSSFGSGQQTDSGERQNGSTSWSGFSEEQVPADNTSSSVVWRPEEERLHNISLRI